jgi:hypothetical protein
MIVENPIVLPIRDDPTAIFTFTVEPIILDVKRVLPNSVETVTFPPYRLDTVMVEPTIVLACPVDVCVMFAYSVDPTRLDTTSVLP